MNKKFRRVKFEEIEQLCSKGIIRKGALMKYKWNKDTIISYQLDSKENEWRFGIVSDINWYVVKPHTYIADKDGMLCHEIGVRDTADNKYIMIDMDHYEICVLE